MGLTSILLQPLPLPPNEFVDNVGLAEFGDDDDDFNLENMFSTKQTNKKN